MRTKKYDLDDIGHIGGDRPYTEEDAQAISAYIQARKAAKRRTKRAATKKATTRSPIKRGAKAKARVA